jgi:hypothetical protein
MRLAVAPRRGEDKTLSETGTGMTWLVKVSLAEVRTKTYGFVRRNGDRYLLPVYPVDKYPLEVRLWDKKTTHWYVIGKISYPSGRVGMCMGL